MARVLWLGDAGCTTGFATVTHAIGDRLVEQFDHDVHVLATNYTGDYWPSSMKLYVPTLRDQRDVFGAKRFIEMLDKVDPEIVISLNDPVVVMKHLFKNNFDQGFLLARQAPLLCYMPIDGTNYPEIITRMPAIVAGLEPLKDARTKVPFMLPVVMSKWGNTVFPQAPIVYHGVDAETFAPARLQPITMSDGTVISSKADAKRALQLPDDCTLAIRVDRNSLRKNYADTVLALVPVMRQNPDLHAWFHCRDEDPAGVDLNLLVSRFPDVMGRFHWPGGYSNVTGWTLNDLLAVYTAADLFVSTSAGEGFGLTLAEAMAMEVPVVAMNVSAITEVVGPGGILLEPERTYVPLSGQDNWLPDIAAFTAAITQLVGSRGQRRTLGQAGRAHVLANFSWDDAAAGFNELITTVIQKTSGDVTVGGTP